MRIARLMTVFMFLATSLPALASTGENPVVKCQLAVVRCLM